MANRTPMGVGEWYHCYNRGVDKRVIFLDDSDYKRFLALMYICNGVNNLRISDMAHFNFEQVLAIEPSERGEPLVDLGVYTLMPNHPHFVLREIRPNGISIFMQKILTGYTMYFNS